MHHNDMVVEKLAGEGGGERTQVQPGGDSVAKPFPLLAWMRQANRQAGQRGSHHSSLFIHHSLLH